MILVRQKKKENFYWKTFTFPASLFRSMPFTLCGEYSEIASLYFFERSGIFPICVADSIIVVWTRSESATKIVSERHVPANWENGLKLLSAFLNLCWPNYVRYSKFMLYSAKL